MSNLPTDIETDIPTDIPTDIQQDIPTDIQQDVPTDIPADVPADVPADIPTNIQMDIQTDIQTDITGDQIWKINESIPIPFRYGVNVPELFPHCQFIADLCRWWKPNIFVEYGLRDCSTTRLIYPYCQKIIGVDMEYHSNMAQIPNLEFYQMKTSEFGNLLRDRKPIVDMAFIDACHRSEVAFQDFRDLFPFLIEDGLIFIHDTYPVNVRYLDPSYCDDSWKVPHLIKKFYGDQCEIMTLPIQPGLTIVKKKLSHLPWLDSSLINYDIFE